VLAGRIVGADGRSSIVRKSLGFPPALAFVSYMAGLVLEDVDLPYEGYGHLLLGGPGPVFVYRIGPHRVRACLDVPLHDRSPTAGPGALWDAFRPVMPASLTGALRSALERRPVAWAANHFRPRIHYGGDRRALVGDAVGCFHPLTAVGLSLGLMDAECLARVATVEAYRCERAARTRVPQALAAALYRVFVDQDETAAAFRRALFGLWRRDAALRERTMRLLAAQDVGIADFARPFLRVTARAAGPRREDVGAARRGRAGHLLACLGESVRWLGAAAFPRVFSSRYPRAAPRVRVVLGPGHRAGADAEAGAPPRTPEGCPSVPGVHSGAEASA
jgi:flavin-dependent dehydrogenase